MTDQINIGNLVIKQVLYDLVAKEITPGLGLAADDVWAKFEAILTDLAPKNKTLLLKRDQIQLAIDNWHKAQAGKPHDAAAYEAFLQEIGYLLPEGDDFQIETSNTDDEIALLAGPQLVVPIDNARFSLNAANARWGSLYDALYGTDVISDDGGAQSTGKVHNPIRGDRVIAYGRAFLDEHLPLAGQSHADATSYNIADGGLSVAMKDGSSAALVDTNQFVGYRGDSASPDGILLAHNGLHLEIQIDAEDSIGKDDLAGVKDILMEAAISTIQDCEDSVAAVDAEDKTNVYRNWLGLMRGDLSEEFQKGGVTMTRQLNPDRQYNAPDGSALVLHGRSLLLIRNVGHLMTTDAVLFNGEEVPEGILDCMMTSLCALYDLKGLGKLSNSRTGSMYIVKPKMHGPEEVAFAIELFARVEQALGLSENTLKIGIMDEERRTTLNLKECIRVAKNRVIFINTGFLDRTGDEIHTSMEAGA
ncbi:MAG: malate synthase G, partial [Pseudomonadales bacterium]|nr:malate synthase G [Pseudomonadales bacterium]